MNGEYFKYPFSETLNYACAAIFKLPFGQRTLTAFDKDKLTYLTPIKRERENSGRCKLSGGETYVIVPSMEIEGKVSEFYLSIYVDCALRDCEIKRVFHPKDEFQHDPKTEVLPFFIPEEAEKLSSNAPTWKLELVRDSIKYMVTDEDVG